MQYAHLIGTKEAMEILGIKRTTLYKLMKKSDFPKPIKIGNLTKFKFEELLEWIEQQRRDNG